MYQVYVLPFFLSLLLSWGCTAIIRRVALKWKVLDRPNHDRKIHTRAIPLLGGWGIFFAFFIIAFLYVFWGPVSLFGSGYISSVQMLGIVLASLVIMISGTRDDVAALSWKEQIVFPLLAIFIVVIFGIRITTITNPFGGYIHLDRFTVAFGEFSWMIFADFLTFIWLLSMMYTTKLLDGLDGLVSGITVIASFFLFFVSLRSDLLQYDTALLAIILAGACLGFLFWNWHPAKIFLGEGGSLLTGFLLGTFSIVAGGKMTTALLVMGIPMLDVLWVIMRRLLIEKKSPLRHADRKHLHHRLLDIGFSHRKTVLVFYLFSIIFGSLIFFIQGKQKIVALFVLVVMMFALGMGVVWKYKKLHM